MQSEKAKLRMELLKRRKALSRGEIRAASEAVVRQMPAVCDWSRVSTVHIYRSLPDLGEIDTAYVIDWLATNQPHVAVTIGESKPKSPVPKGQFDIIFVPVVGFDRENFRLGMGGGWYDRWLATQPQAQKIGLAYAWAELGVLPHEPHDVELDLVVSGEEAIVADATSR
ncbi:hypothetical protein IPL85_05985 [Candidatus Saccharibacteria bacterium]|nr:MAG: hypothetical protein IPL85_05985 [Candidatus Saccharibacteria bacterium]